MKILHSKKISYISLSLGLILIGLGGTVLANITPTKSLPNPAKEISPSLTQGKQTAIFAGGCFWGLEAVFEHLTGVSEVVSGFSGGTTKNPSYEQVSSGTTGHAEAVKIIYDPKQISYGQLLKIFFAVAHDPTQLNRQGPDTGSQYRSAIFFTNSEQEKVAKSYIQQLNQAHVFNKPIVTQIMPFKDFYAAENYHQDFIKHNPAYPYVVINDLPKLNQLKQQFSNLYKP